MEIKYLGHSSFLIKSKTAKLVTDPYDSKEVGIKFPRVEADVVTISHQHSDHNQASEVNGTPLVIDMPGEFEKNNFRISGYLSYHDKKKGAERGENIIYKIEADGIVCLHCGDLGEIPNRDFIDNAGKIDVLFVPVGGYHSLDADEAVEIIKEIEPSIVIPMHYNAPYINQKLFGNIAPVEEFIKKIGAEGIAPVSKLIIKKEDLSGEMKVVVMEP